MFRVEYLIYFYIVLCVLMIFFNYFYMLHRSRRYKKIQQGNKKLIKYMEQEISCIINEYQITEKSKKYLKKKLKSVYNLYIVEDILNKHGLKIVEAYINEYKEVFCNLCKDYIKKDVIARSYFAYFVGKYRICNDRVIEYLLSLLRDDEIYCIDNSLQALYSFGNVNYIIHAFKIVDSSTSYQNENMILKGLQTYTGDKEKLIEFFVKNFDVLTEKIKIVIIRYITEEMSNKWNEELYGLILDSKNNKKIKIEIIKYFAVHYDKRIKDILFKILELPVINNKEYIKVSVGVLKNYPGDDTIKALKKVLQMKEWELQVEAAKVLNYLVSDSLKLADIYNGDNKNARHILRYINDKNKKIDSENSIRGQSGGDSKNYVKLY